jgi:hypothetical protein
LGRAECGEESTGRYLILSMSILYIYIYPYFSNMIICTCIFLVVLGFELRALQLLGSCSATRVTPPVLFCFSYFSDKVLHFCLELALDHNPPNTPPYLAVHLFFVSYFSNLLTYYTHTHTHTHTL